MEAIVGKPACMNASLVGANTVKFPLVANTFALKPAALNALLSGANTVNVPNPFKVSVKPALLIAALRIENSLFSLTKVVIVALLAQQHCHHLNMKYLLITELMP